MSFHVYISKPGFKEEPIDYDDWVASATKVASSNNNLTISEKKRKGHKSTFYAHLDHSKRQRLVMNRYGLIHAQDPTRELIEIMFKIANELNASVYSERLKAYKDVDDWEKRTKQFRERLAERRAAYRSKKMKKQLFFLILVLLGLVTGILLSEKG